MKGKEKERERRMKRAVEHQLTTSHSSSRGSFFLCVGFGAKLTLTADEEDDNPFTTTVIMQKNQQRTQNHISIEFLLNGCP